jgi:hypothetical protein
MFEPKTIDVITTHVDEDEGRVSVAGRALVCAHCGGDRFDSRSAKLNTTFAELFDLAWANRSATCFVCRGCTRIEWFLGPRTE